MLDSKRSSDSVDKTHSSHYQRLFYGCAIEFPDRWQVNKQFQLVLSGIKEMSLVHWERKIGLGYLLVKEGHSESDI